MSLQLRPYQRAAIDAIYDYFGRASGHPVVVIPTAGGKSLVMAEFVREVLQAWPDQRILIITHVRELSALIYGNLASISSPTRAISAESVTSSAVAPIDRP